ncbi:MAG TPA: BON domain-containing protein [Elusimicrobiota bacterium]|nr:BON domain-containing protein [Elusimicrobiota bacterium]
MRYPQSAAGAIAALSLFLAAVVARGQSNQSGGQQLNPNTSLNSIVNGGSTGVAPPVRPVVVPVTPASDKTAPASLEKDRPSKGPLPVEAPPPRPRLSDRRLRRKLRDSIAGDRALPEGSRRVGMRVSHGKVTLDGAVLSANDKYRIEAKAAELAGPENVTDLIVVRPPARPPSPAP